MGANSDHNQDGSDEQQRRSEIYTYEAPWHIYAMNWSVRRDKKYRLAIASLLEQYSNRVEIVQLDDSNGEIRSDPTLSFEHPYPPTKVIFIPDKECQKPDLLATSSDFLRIWRISDEDDAGADEETTHNGSTNSRRVEMKSLLNNNRNSEFCGPVTSFDWNEAEPKRIGTSSIDTTCTIWAAVSGAVFARVAMGTACDLFGPRLASSSLILLTAPAVFLSAIANSPAAFLMVRFFTGFSLATFVSTQFWMSSMFSPNVVGTANGLSGGWGNLGGGATQLIMPLVYSLIHTNVGSSKFTAWRIAFFIPAIFQTLSAYAIFFLGQDMPDGNYVRLEKSGEKHKDSFSQVFYHAITNYRGWILALTYGYCFGVELTIDNIIAQYFYDRFNVNLHTAGIIAASFGLANLFSRPGGGILSDWVAKRFGMRGRLWTLWVVQMIGGLLCLLLGKIGSLSGSVAVMLVFSVFVQAACGLTFGVVPFVSRRSLGVISGMTGGGGNVGAVLTQVIFFRGSRYSTEEGISLMGVMIMCCTLVIVFIYFPQWGGLFCGPREGVTEEDYYLSEWTDAEKEQGFHKISVKFSENSRRERGKKGASVPIQSDKETPSTIV